MRLRAGVLLVAGAAIVACGLDVVGTTVPDGVESTTPEGGAAISLEEAGASEPEPERIGDGRDNEGADAAPPAETPVDAGAVDAGPCGPSALVDNFAQGLGSWTHYGGVQQGVAQNGNAYARLIAEGANTRAAGLFWLPTVKAKAFKATFAYYIATPYSYWYMGDGLTFTWLTSTGGASLGTGAIAGQGLGLQPGVAGHAFALDGRQHASIGDRGAPSFSFFDIDPSRGNPGSYDWHIENKGPYRRSDVYDAWRTIEITVANGRATAQFRFVPNGSRYGLFENVPVDTSADIVAMGFTASTGSAEPMGFFVDTVSFELTDAVCP